MKHLILLLMLFIGCSSHVTPVPVPLPTPPVVNHTVKVEWPASPDEDVDNTGVYIVYRASYPCTKFIRIASVGEKTYNDNVVAGNYCYTVTFLLNGEESNYAPKVSVQVI